MVFKMITWCGNIYHLSLNAYIIIFVVNIPTIFLFINSLFIFKFIFVEVVYFIITRYLDIIYFKSRVIKILEISMNYNIFIKNISLTCVKNNIL